jgi:hypothetical protein
MFFCYVKRNKNLQKWWLKMIKFFKKIQIQKILILIMFIFTAGLVGCSGGEVVEEEKFVVVYDGNGGYLGNKTNTFRRLEVAVNSKIPKYLSDYAQDPYVVSSLGLATRQGYNLLGWYLEENAEYAPNPNGAYVYLDMEDGNGVYTINDEGQYVYGYILDEFGPLIYIYVEPIGENDPETTEYIFFNGGNGLGFYIYNSEDAAHVEVYEVDGGYSPSGLAKYVGYLEFNDLTNTEKELFQDIPRFRQDFYEYTEVDEGLARYNLESGYVYFDTIFEESVNGEYVVVEGIYEVYDSENPEHADLDRYTIANRYVFTPSAEIVTPSDLDRFNADITYWDFEVDRVTKDITLIANWEKKLTVNFVQKSGQVTVITTKQNETNTAPISLVAGETIGKLETIPTYPGYTFVGWSTSMDEYLPWDFNNDVFPLGTSELNLYAYMIQGEYTRITTASGLLKVVDNPNGKYLLASDIDLNGAVFDNSTPLGFKLRTTVGATIVPFTGEFVSLGATISNFTLLVKNLQKELLADSGVVVVSALFPYVQNAKISGINLYNVEAELSTTSTSTTVVCSIGVAGIIGTALEGTTLINNVHVDLVISVNSSNIIDYPVYIGDVVARGIENTIITESTANFDYSSITGITTDVLYVEELPK